MIMPVASIATWLTPRASSQSESPSRLVMVVEKVSRCSARWPVSSGTRKHAVTLAM
jgi:hypothetical protein